MNTPIFDFLENYKNSDVSRLHMPGHKGNSFLGCEEYDITEIAGADNLYSADGIIKTSEDNASQLFGTAKTLYSTEGSSQCIKAMVYLASMYKSGNGRPYILASRNAHKAFIYALALNDIDVAWVYPKQMNSLCSCNITSEQIENFFKNADAMPIAVYVTSPDYLGGQLDIQKIAEVCHKYDTLLLVDNAHGAYLGFTPEKNHPINIGADICCDSAHKTLPVLTGGAYLHISKNTPSFFTQKARNAMSVFGSTSPSYLTLCSLDLCNKYLSDNYKQKLAEKIDRVRDTKKRIINNGWSLEETEPLKITVKCPENLSGTELASNLRKSKIECEYADKDYVVLMLTTETKEDELNNIVNALGKNIWGKQRILKTEPVILKSIMTICKAVFSSQETVNVSKAEGRVCAFPTANCPPAIPISVPGEVISKAAIELFSYYGIDSISVIKE